MEFTENVKQSLDKLRLKCKETEFPSDEEVENQINVISSNDGDIVIGNLHITTNNGVVKFRKIRCLYLISTKTLQYPADLDRTEHGLEPLRRGCIIKVGEAIDADVRVKTLDGTFIFEKPTILKVWKNSPLSDKEVHTELEKRGFPKYREDRDREFFEFDSIEQATREINDIIYGTKKLKIYSSREEQIDIVNDVCKLFKSNISKKEKSRIIKALINAKMRFGKCHVSYKIINKMKFKRILILTYKPNGVFESWEDDVDHVEFKDFVLKRSSNLEQVKFVETDKVEIIFASFQDALGEVKDCDGNVIKGNKDKWDTIFGQEIDLVIKDEDHYGYETERSISFLSKLNYVYELALSGTPFKAILDGKYSKEEVFTWTYLQEQTKRREEREGGWKTNIYRPLPEFEIFSCNYDNGIINEFLKYYNEEEKVTNFKLFSNEKLVYDFLTWVKLDPSMNNLITNHMFWYLPQIINCDTIEKVLSEHIHWKDYTVVNASGDKVKDLEDTKNRVYDKKSKTITLSCGRWNTGTTVKQWNSVWMLDDGYSAENWFQTIMRCGSPWIGNEGNFLKEKVHVVDFNSDRMLKCYIEYSTIISKYVGYEPSEYVSEMLKCMPIFSVNGSSIVEIKSDDLLEHFNIILTDYFGSLSMLDRTKIDNVIKEILVKIHGTLSNVESKKLNDSSKGRGKNSKREKRSNGKSGEVEKIEDYIIKARLITNRFKNFLFVVNDIENNIKTVEDIFNHSDEFEIQVGMNVEDFKKLLDKGFILEEKINDSINLFNICNDYLFN